MFPGRSICLRWKTTRSARKLPTLPKILPKIPCLKTAARLKRASLKLRAPSRTKPRLSPLIPTFRSRWATFMLPSVWMRCHTLCLKKSRPKLPSICAACWKNGARANFCPTIARIFSTFRASVRRSIFLRQS